ncbi:Pumilio-like protein [Thalictrum thalictroides]|uniref:Pumilio-like protein n=1 Tax=Thalictrum thalictroides TaxID=46969 RepID=A0A7J6UY54_THATH|nr:Pumilio-like protein [Thalictrum thalictroides]
MATESPMRIMESTGVRKWPSSKDAATYTSSGNIAAEELGLLLKGHRFQVNRREIVPNRSGSAPPSMEGSLVAIGNLIAQQNPNVDANLENLSHAIKNCESEEQLRSDPAYLAYYYSNVNLKPRLPPPLISRENRRLVRHIGGFGSNWKMTSFDDSSNGSLHLSQGTLTTHKEESEDDRSPRKVCGDWVERSAFLSGQYISLAGRHKSLVDLIQEDFPRTPSPVYNHQLSSNHATVQEVVEPDGHGKSLHDSSLSTENIPEVTVAAVSAGTPTSRVHGLGLISNSDSPPVPVARSLSPEGTGNPKPGRKGKSGSVATQVKDGSLVSDSTDSDITSVESEMKDFSISVPQDMKNQSSSLQQHHLRAPRGAAHQVQGTQSQIFPQGMNHSYNGMDQFPLHHPKFSTEVQPVLQSSGMAPPLYATATAYMASGGPFYPNSSLFAPQYSLGGYALNTTLLPPFMTGYTPHSAIPMGFDATAGPSFSHAHAHARAGGVSTGGSIAPGVDFQHPYKFYGQLGLPMQPSFADPVYMQYFQQNPPTDGQYGISNPYDPLGPRGSIFGSQVESLDSQKGPLMTAYTADRNPQYQRSGGTNHNRGGHTSPNYYGSPPSMGVLQLPTSPLATPVQGSPMGGIGPAGKRNDLRFSPGSSRSTGTYCGWQGQKGTDKLDDSKTFSFLEELKSSKARKFELSEITGRIVEFRQVNQDYNRIIYIEKLLYIVLPTGRIDSVCMFGYSADQHGSRFIQQKLENCSIEEKSSVFKEILPHASKLMTDVFGNYVIQKFFEHGSPEQRKELADQLAGHIMSLSLQMYGCRVIQKALEVIELDQKTRLVHELDGHVLKCVRDQNGNHVIQKCIECVPTEKIGFIISSFRGQVAALSTHPYGCRVIQRVLEYCTDELQSTCIVDEILESACALAEDQYGNYVTQHVLEKGKPHERNQIISKMAGKIVQLSQHKFASNVVEKCLSHGDYTQRELLIDEIVGQTEGNDNLLTMMKDQFANYVVQKILEICTDKQREILLGRIRVHLHALKKYTYGKHIVVRFEQWCGEEDHAVVT